MKFNERALKRLSIRSTRSRTEVDDDDCTLNHQTLMMKESLNSFLKISREGSTREIAGVIAEKIPG